MSYTPPAELLNAEQYDHDIQNIQAVLTGPLATAPASANDIINQISALTSKQFYSTSVGTALQTAYTAFYNSISAALPTIQATLTTNLNNQLK